MDYTDKGGSSFLEAELMGRIPVSEKEGFTYGEFTSVETSTANLSEYKFSVKSKLGQVDGFTSFGGPHSKYKENEDTIFAVALPENLTVGVVDGAGGSGNGRLASTLAT